MTGDNDAASNKGGFTPPTFVRLSHMLWIASKQAEYRPYRNIMSSTHRHTQTGDKVEFGLTVYGPDTKSTVHEKQAVGGRAAATICLRPLLVGNVFVFIRQVAPVPACWLFNTSATS